MEKDTFTVSFFPTNYQKALGIMGSHSGRDVNKVEMSGLTPVAMGESITYKEANLTFFCRKIYQHPFAKESLATDIQEYYQTNTRSFPADEHGEWQPHWMFIGEIIDVDDKR